MDSLAQRTSKSVVLHERPTGIPQSEHFRLVDRSLTEPGKGELLCQNLYLSLDPFIRARLNAGPSYADPVKIGSVVPGLTASRVILSNSDQYRPGDIVVGMGGWQEYVTITATEVRKAGVDPLPLTTALGVLGMPGLTAYVGLLDMGCPEPGTTVVVSAAAGSVGSVVGQIAKMRRCRAVGIVGSAEKRQFVLDLGFDACIDYSKTDNLADDLQVCCPDGIDVYFDNVGGDTFGAVATLLNLRSRIVLCGMISNLNSDRIQNIQDLRPLFVKRTQLRPILVSDHFHRYDEFLGSAKAWVQEGHLRYRENIVRGLEQSASAFRAALTGHAIGKQIVEIAASFNRSPERLR